MQRGRVRLIDDLSESLVKIAVTNADVEVVLGAGEILR